MTADKVTTHFQNDRRQGKRKAYPESAGHVRKFRVGRCIEGCHFGLQRHSTDWAVSGTDLTDLRMHRASIDRALRHSGLRLAFVEICLGVGGEFGPAACRAEVKGFAAVVEPV